MPVKSQNFGFKKCLNCENNIIHKVKRDIERKKYCSRKCLGKYLSQFQTKEQLEKMIKAASTPEANAKKSNKGENHPKWIKDRTLVKDKRSMHEGKEWRKQVFERDNYTCQCCGQKGGKLNADHIKPYALYPELRLDLNNGRTLCITCHKQTSTYGMRLVWQMRKSEVSNSFKK